MNKDDALLLTEVQGLVDERFPGILLESAIQGWAYLGDFAAGVKTYQSLSAPNGKDDRWLGVCLFQRFEDMLAQEAFYRALAKGEEAARVNLAHLLRFLERSEEAVSELLRVDVNQLSPYDNVLYLRVSSLHEETNGNMRKAIEFAEQAWRKVQGIPEFQILAPSVLAQLGILYGRVGEARRGLWFLDHGIKLTSGLEQQKVKLRRATLLINLGRADDASMELLSLGELPEALEVERTTLRGELAWSTGLLTEAVACFTAVVEAASPLALGSDEFTARLSLVAIFGHKGEHAEAYENLSKARILMSDRTDVLLHRFREVLLNVNSRQYGLTDAISELEMLANEFHRLGTFQEEASVRLHIANFYRLSGDEKLISELVSVQRICQFVHNNLFLAKEWVLLPELRSFAVSHVPTLFSTLESHLKLVTIGSELLILNGEPVKLPLRRAVELLAYFLEFRQVSLSRVICDVFPDVKVRTARSYFHQFRFQVRISISGLEVAFDGERGLYELQGDVNVQWDVSALRRGELPGQTGQFLPTSTSGWAQKVDQEVQELLGKRSK
jgi:hypothetical protein